MPKVSHKTVTVQTTTSEWSRRELLVVLGVIHKDQRPDPDERIDIRLTSEGNLVVEVVTTEDKNDS
jgi:hypothetical protein